VTLARTVWLPDEVYILVSRTWACDSLLEEAVCARAPCERQLECIGSKNSHELSRLLKLEGVAETAAENWLYYPGLAAKFAQVLVKASEIRQNETAKMRCIWSWSGLYRS
jgi:hypothetical protein